MRHAITNLGSGSLLGGSGSSGLLGSGSGRLLCGGGSSLLGSSGLLGGRSLLDFGLLLLSELGAAGGTLGLLEDTLVDTVLESLVEERVELLVGGNVEVVVGLDVLLEVLTAEDGVSLSMKQYAPRRWSQPVTVE